MELEASASTEECGRIPQTGIIEEEYTKVGGGCRQRHKKQLYKEP